MENQAWSNAISNIIDNGYNVSFMQEGDSKFRCEVTQDCRLWGNDDLIIDGEGATPELAFANVSEKILCVMQSKPRHAN